MTNPQPNFLVILQPGTEKIVLTPCGDQWTIPQLHGLDDDALDIEAITRDVQEQLGLSTILLGRITDTTSDGDSSDEPVIFVLEARKNIAYDLLNGKWVSPGEIRNHSLTHPEHQGILENWIVQQRNLSDPISQIAWFQRGWFDKVSDWIHDQLRKQGLIAKGDVEQQYLRIWSCILRILTDQGYVYFKATIPVCKYEETLTQALHQLWPAHMPEVIACEHDRAWLLMRDSGKNLGDTMEEEGDANPRYYEEALAIYARIQRESRQYLNVLNATGYPDYRLKKLPELYAKLLQDTEALALDKSHGLTSEEYKQLQEFTPRVREICAELEALGIPETLHHDDLWCGNIMHQNGNYVFFDWAESGFGHPFSSLYTLLKHAKYRLNYDDAFRDRLRDSYLAHWVDYAPLDKLKEGFAVAQRIALLYRGLSWHRMFTGVPEKMRGPYISEVPAYMRSFLQGNYWD